ncbi:creatinine amidohydrolase [Geomicrobium sp. JCM 19037]|uniref:creatininase family protein n=1 Tax=unclassified Geomicrobium TaxID=2628951 RepID=UPI00045F17EB|nr:MULTISPECIES: creatininase family protein [unclassified Geomicrobium]GAK03881.1 creatinine amidohydrolase [Geomicrobium sp. JCM 19037]GAK12387.1 creatinine amidohydrolase [Geomicrobium sp. JCM 19039]
MSTSKWLQDQKWKDVENYLTERQDIIIPVGSVEQHAHHLPMGTDSYVSIAVAESVAEKTGTLIAPPVWVGWAPHHMAFPGTITLRPETLTALLTDIANSLIYHGFKRIHIINGHREANLPPIKTAATKVRNHTGAYISVIDPFYIAKEIAVEIRQSEPGGVGHAAEMETSHMYYLHPELCDPEAASKNIHQSHRYLNHDPFVETDKVFVPSDIHTYRETAKGIGVVGDPTVSTKENGKVYHDRLVASVSEFIDYCHGEVDVSIRNRELPL